MRTVKVILLTMLLSCFLLNSTSFGSLTTTIVPKPTADWWTGGSQDRAWRWAKEVESLVDATAGTATASKAVVLNSSSQINSLKFSTDLRLLESAGATYYTILKAGNQAADLTYIMPTAYGTTGQVLSSTDAGVLSWATATGTYTGGNITSDMTLNVDGIDIFADTTLAHTYSIGVRDTDASAYLDVLRWTNATTPTIVLGHANASFALASTGLDISTIGALTNVSTIDTSGAVTVGGALSANSWTIGAGTFSTTGATTLGDGTATVAISSTGMDVSTAGAVSNVTTLGMSGDLTNSGGDIILANGKGVKASTTTAQTVGVYGYDTDGAYVGALVITNSATPASVLGNANGTTAITSSDWAISTSGAATGLGAVTMDGTLTLANSETILNDTDGEIEFAGNGTEDVSFGFGTSNTLTMTTDTGVDTVAWGVLDAFTGLETITGDNSNSLSFATNNGFVFADNSEDIILDLTTADTFTLVSTTGVVNFALGTVDAVSGVESITGDNGQSINFSEDTILTFNEATEDLQFIFTSNQVQLGTTTGVAVFDVNSMTLGNVVNVRGASSNYLYLGANNRFEFSDNSETFGFDVGTTSNTVEFTTDSGIDTVDCNAMKFTHVLKVVTHDTNGKTLDIGESGTVQTNAGAVGAAAWTLPGAAAGIEYTFVVMAAQELRVTPAAGDVININGIAADAAEYWTANAAGECLHLIAVDATNWVALSYTGTWTQATP